MYLDFLSTIVSQNQLNPVMQQAKNDRSVLRALPVYDNWCATISKVPKWKRSFLLRNYTQFFYGNMSDKRLNLDSERILLFFSLLVSDFRAVWWQKGSHQQLSAMTDFHNNKKIWGGPYFRGWAIFSGTVGDENLLIYLLLPNCAVKPVLVATSIKQATCIKRPVFQFPFVVNKYKSTCLKQALIIYPTGACLIQVGLYIH